MFSYFQLDLKPVSQQFYISIRSKTCFILIDFINDTDLFFMKCG